MCRPSKIDGRCEIRLLYLLRTLILYISCMRITPRFCTSVLSLCIERLFIFTAVSRTLSVWTFSYVTNFRARRNFPSQRYIATPTVAFRRPLPVKGAPPRAFVLNKQNVHEQSYRTIPCTTLLVVRADSTLVLRSALHGRLFEGTPG